MPDGRRAIGQVDCGPAATQRPPEGPARIDSLASWIGQEAARGYLVVRQGHLGNQPLGHGDLGG
jgi:hypothetical protein